MKKLLCFLPLLLFCSGCGPDFGDKIYDWVEANARSYSEQLTRNDLKVRWLKAFSDHYKTIAFHSETARGQMKQLYTSTVNNEAQAGEGLGALLTRYDHSRAMLNELIRVKEILERNDSLFQSLDSIGNGRQFEAAGLRAIGKETLMRSFLEIGETQSTINKLRYQKLFSLKYAIAISENGDVSQSVDNSGEGQGYSYSGSFEQFWYDNPVTGPLMSLFVQDDIEEQVDHIWEAIDRFDELCLKPHEQFAISQEYVTVARSKYAEHHRLADSIHLKQKENWLQLYQWNAARFKQAEAGLQPYRLQLAEAEFQGSREVQRILDEETRFALRQELVDMVSYVRQQSHELQNENERFAKIEKLEKLENSIAEASYVLNTLLERKELTSLHAELKNYQLRIGQDSTTAATIKKQLMLP